MAYNVPPSRSTGDLCTAAIWNADVVANEIAIYAGGLSIASQAVGDVLYASSTTQLGRVGIGSANKVLTSSGSAPQWVTQLVNAALPTNIDVGGTLDVTGVTTLDSTLAVSSTAATAIDVAGGITAGTGNVALVGTDGKINGPLSSTIIDDLSGANLTTLNASNISSGTLANARLPTNVDLGGTLDVTGVTTLDSTLDVTGVVTLDGLRVETKDKTSAYTLVATDFNITADAVGGAFSVTLIASPTDGQTYTIRRVNSGANDVTIAGNSVNINGESSIALTEQYESVILIYNSSDGEWGVY